MIKAIIVDDERLILSEIEALAKESGVIQVAKAYYSAVEALAEIGVIKPQVAFIDIAMPELDGITLAEKLLEKDPSIRIVFITSYDQYAVKAFELNALDYLLKPVNPKRFLAMVKKTVNSIPGQGYHSEELLEIQSFGDLEVKIDGQRVKWERLKAEELFAYLLMKHDQKVHKETLLEELWPEYDPQKALPILQTSVCKLRHIFAPVQSKVRLEYGANRYTLMISDCICDLFFVEEVLSRCTKAGAEDYSLVERAGLLISKGLLRGQGYLWALERAEQMRTRLCFLLRTYADSFLAADNCGSAVRPLKLLLKVVPYDEAANNQLLQCYGKMNYGAGIIDHYRWLERVLKDDYDMEPAISTREIYKKLYGEKYGRE